MTAPNDQLAAAVRGWLDDLTPAARAEFLDGLDTTDQPKQKTTDAKTDDAYPANWKKN